MTIPLTLKQRATGAQPRAMRREGRIPAVLYGHRGTQSLALELEQRTAEDLLKRVTINNTILPLKVERGWSGDVLLREVQHDAVGGKLLHLSFFAVAGHGSITLDLPLVFTGEAVGVKMDGGLLEKVLTQLTVNTPPTDVPEAIEVDISTMQVGDMLYVKDLVLPPGIEVVNTPDLVVAHLTPSPTGRALQSMDAAESAVEQPGEQPATAAG
ncbi:50S ribosomal protein L25/general stress protein Ctc [Gloeobacter violaceus]|uniref:Large ribosomal subunit protein bL25 n=1 Tax=Gloeobacter violaceus (strain ATCC 29082 / PCC 7421) TaxID=251221 RepID=RL25_GLOVI|nr:50S ribosomal protein L25/general stress protein Ctc [Gloeobacter violaceus]Q7NNL2.1 RecName: Full=Large ribosomal subunit protein bL25; AltName: Full=50S ribosomal protein L25; AltName: Full=General stress protein CTC [Gloeobacter violaceus PCC 7421]BAC88340.1 50S ribosomal protein L25 [Gloeobacter violaceus PCC 7421]